MSLETKAHCDSCGDMVIAPAPDLHPADWMQVMMIHVDSGRSFHRAWLCPDCWGQLHCRLVSRVGMVEELDQ
jgi:hypothetical protein